MSKGKETMVKELLKTGRYTLKDRVQLLENEESDLEILCAMCLDTAHKYKIKYIKKACRSLTEEIPEYKKVIKGYSNLIEESLNNEDKSDNALKLYKKLIRVKELTTNVLNTMELQTVILNNEIHKLCDYLEKDKDMDIEAFINTFEITYNEDEEWQDEDFYNNLLMSGTKIGHVIRNGLINTEKFVKENIL